MAISPHAKITILLMVSDPVILSVMEDVLDHAGYTVIPARGIGDAVDRLKEVKPDLLVTRTYVDGMPGHDAALYLRTRCKHMKVLMVGGLLDDERLKYRESLQGFHVFPKPYSAHEMLHKVKEVLEAPPL